MKKDFFLFYHFLVVLLLLSVATSLAREKEVQRLFDDFFAFK